MGSVVFLGLVLLAVLFAAVRMLVGAIGALDLDPAPLRADLRALSAARAPAFEAISEANASNSARDRDAWLAESEGVLRHVLRVPVAELRACAKIATAAAFCIAAWSVRSALASNSGDDGNAGDEVLGRALGCVGLGLVATGALVRVHRVGARAIARDRDGFAALVAAVERREIASPVSEPGASSVQTDA